MIPDWLRHPKWKWLRPPLGVLLVIFGLLGFLPVLGFWMIPLGLAVLAVDFPAAQRAEAWLAKRTRAALVRFHAWRAGKD